MKKRKSKSNKLLKTVFLTLGISLFFVSCEKMDDLDENIPKIEKRNVTAKRITINEIRENKTLKKSLLKIEKQFDYIKKTNNLSKTIKTKDNGQVSIYSRKFWTLF